MWKGLGGEYIDDMQCRLLKDSDASSRGANPPSRSFHLNGCADESPLQQFNGINLFFLTKPQFNHAGR